MRRNKKITWSGFQMNFGVLNHQVVDCGSAERRRRFKVTSG